MIVIRLRSAHTRTPDGCGCGWDHPNPTVAEFVDHVVADPAWAEKTVPGRGGFGYRGIDPE